MLKNLRPAAWCIWAGLAVGLLALEVWFPPLDTGVTHDTYSAAADGQRAFYRLVGTELPTSRSTEPLVRSIDQLIEQEDTLCILGPARWPTAAEWDALLSWVQRGGQLVFACSGVEEKTIPHVSVRYVPHANATPDDSLPPETRLVTSREIAWWTDGHLTADMADVLVEYDGEVQAVAVGHGAGTLVVVATALVFSNQLLTYGDNPALAFRLLEAAGPVNYVTFDESLNASGTAKATGVLLDSALRPLTLQLCLLLVLYAWWNGLRYGPLARPAVSLRHNLVDHTDALGVHYWRMADGTAMLRSYLRALRAELGLRDQSRTMPAMISTAARRLNRTVASVQDDIESARQAARQKTLDRRIAARLMTRIAVIHRAILRTHRGAP